jgi:hypothetical protein
MSKFSNIIFTETRWAEVPEAMKPTLLKIVETDKAEKAKDVAEQKKLIKASAYSMFSTDVKGTMTKEQKSAAWKLIKAGFLESI